MFYCHYKTRVQIICTKTPHHFFHLVHGRLWSKSTSSPNPSPDEPPRDEHIAHGARIPRETDEAQKPALDHPPCEEARDGQRGRDDVPAVQQDQERFDVVEQHGPADVVGRAEGEAEGIRGG